MVRFKTSRIGWVLIFLCYLVLDVSYVHAQITMSSHLNCKFTGHCRWQNSTTAMGRWLLSDYVDIDNYYTIKPMSDKREDFFAYTSSKSGFPPAELVSDIINCQLGGGKIKYWYYQTGKSSTLQICLRSPNNVPPGEPQCYNGLSSTKAHQWIFHTVELPPFSKPTEIVLRAYYGAANDAIALDDIVYDAILCGNSRQIFSRKRKKRMASWSTIPIVDVEKWKTMKMKIEREGKQPPLMLIVAADEENTVAKESRLVPEAEENEEEDEAQSKFEREERISTKKELRTTTTESPTTIISTTTPAPTTTKATTALALLTASEPTTETSEKLLFGKSTTESPNDKLINFMTLFKQMAPLLPAIPSIVKSFSPEQSLGLASPVQARGVTTYTGSQGFPNLSGVSRPQDSGNEWKLFGEPVGSPDSSLFESSLTTEAPLHVLAHGTPIKPMNGQNRGVYTQSFDSGDFIATAKPPRPDVSTVYPPNSFGIKKNLHKLSETSKLTSPIPMDLSQLTMKELRQLEAIHRKLFTNKSSNKNDDSTAIPIKETPYLTRMLPTLQPATSPPRSFESDDALLDQESFDPKTTNAPPLMVYEKPKFTTPKSLRGVNFGAGSSLTPEMVNELRMLREIPDLEELTEGMDLSLLNKPGGFAVLKQQFIERLIQRSTKKLLNGRKRRTKNHRFVYN